MGWRELWGSGLGRARSSRPFWVPALEQSSGTQNGRELLALPRQESQSSHQRVQNDPNMVPFWSQIGPKMVPLATQNLDNCKGGPTKIDV